MSLQLVFKRVALPTVLVVVLFMTTSGCGSGGKITVAEPATSAETATTEPEADDVDVTTTTANEATTTTASEVGAPTSTGSTTPADADAVDVSWTLSASEYRGRDGLRVGYVCPPAGTPATVWGSGPFTDDSSVCTAAVFAGLFTTADGGRVVIRIDPGQESYPGGDVNGITASEYGSWDGSFTVLGT